MAGIFNLLFGCTHKNYSFPITPRNSTRKPAAALTTGTYVVCTDCGAEFPYDWQGMKIVSANYVSPVAEESTCKTADVGTCRQRVE